MAKVTCVLLLASFMQVEGSYFLAGWQLWWVHICKEPINWSSCLWCCPQLFLRPTQTYPPRPRLYQLIMPVPSESNYKKPHLHTPTFFAPFPSLTIYLKVIKLGFLALKHLPRSWYVRKWWGTARPKAIFPPSLSLSVPQRLTLLKELLQSYSLMKLCTSQYTLSSWLLSLNFWFKLLNSFFKRPFSSSTAIFVCIKLFISCCCPVSLYLKKKKIC